MGRDISTKIFNFFPISRNSPYPIITLFLQETNIWSNLLHITVSGSITIVQLFLILRSRTQCLLSGDFRLSIMTPLPSLVSCETLQLLKLTLRVADAFAFPWAILRAPELRVLEMNLTEINGVSSLIGREMEAFRSMHPNTIISILP